MKTSRICTLFIAMLLLAALPSVASLSVPVRNFSRSDYRGGAQNWDAVQDSLGRIYIGNHIGMLRFDGNRWQRLYLKNYTTVRAMLFDKDTDRVYAGGSEEFGYFHTPAGMAKPVYVSLSDSLPPEAPKFTEIWNIYKHAGRTWFQADHHIFAMGDGRALVYDPGGRVSCSVAVGGTILVGREDGTLLSFDGSAFVRVPGSALLEGKKIVTILPFGTLGRVLIGTDVDGIYLFDGRSVETFGGEISDFVKANRLFCGASMGENYIFGTVDRGAVIANFRTGKILYVNRENGLQNNTVLGAAFDRVGNIWLCLDNGLDYVVYNSPVTGLIDSANSIGAGSSSCLRNGRLFLGTNQGLYSMEYPVAPSPSPVALRQELKGQIWSVDTVFGQLMVCSDAGAFFSESGGRFRRIPGLPGVHMVKALDGSPGYALAATYERFHILRFDGDDWTDCGAVDGYGDTAGSFVIDSEGYVWHAHWRRGVYRMKLDVGARSFSDVILIDNSAGLPNIHDTSVMLFGGKVLIGSYAGFFRYNAAEGNVDYAEDLEEIFGKRFSGRVSSLPDGTLIRAGLDGLEVARPSIDGYDIDSTTFRSLGEKVLPGYISINTVEPRKIVVSNQDGFWDIDLAARPVAGPAPAPFVAAVYANRDSLVYQAASARVPSARLVLPYSLNTLRFEFAAPEFTARENIEFSSRLIGYDNEWTPYSPEANREFTRLSEGAYTLELRSRHKFSGTTGTVSLPLRINPPWYRSVAAKIVYSVLAILFLMGMYFLILRWIRNAQMQVERRKTKELEELRLRAEQEALHKDYQIATLKSEQLEHDIRHKSSELSNTTMNLIRKNEILHDIASRIAKIQSIPGIETGAPQALKQLARIQTAIEENISHDDDWKSFSTNFDIVYQNYTKRLLELHPNLTVADKRICCYIKMGLSSKEIAPLVNISFKSVEMARYRLRKKMNLPPEVSLTDYLDKI